MLMPIFIFMLGSKDEASGNQACTATLEDDGSLTLRIRMPNALSKFGKYITISNGKTKEQSLALIGDACAQIVAHAEKTLKPIILEDLDFQKKKQSLRETHISSFARTLSSFACMAILTHIQSRAL